MAITKLVWIALPNGLQDNLTFRISAYLAPALVAADDATVAAFPLFGGWPSTASALRFQLSFDGGTTWSSPLSAAYTASNQLDGSLWTSIFGGRVLVGAHDPKPLSGDLQSYPADVSYLRLRRLYGPDPGELPPDPPPGSGIPVTPNAPLVSSNRLAALAAELRSVAGPQTPVQQAFARFADFHRPRQRTGAARAPSVDAGALPNADALDFHATVSALSRYPAAMRALGLVFDLVLPIPVGLPLVGTVRVRPVSNAFPADWRIVYPASAYELSADRTRFTLRTNLTDSGHQLRGGMLVSDSATLIPIDLDALGAASLNAINGSTPPNGATPTPRNTGFSFTLPALDTRLQTQMAAGINFWQSIATNDDTADHGDGLSLFAEDLIRGYRVDVRTVEQNRWNSLCRRVVSFDFGGFQRTWAEDEGLIGLGISQEGDAAPRFSPMQFRWQGWSLCAPRPGKSIGLDGGADEQNQVVQALLPFKALIQAVPGSLPRLRFNSGHYQVRLRTVDLAGNSIAFDAPVDDAFAMPSLVPDNDNLPGTQYLRVDPLPAPVLLMRDAAGPGESVERLVIVSDVDTPAPRNCERLVAMPKAAVHTAEWHARFDSPLGVNGGAATRTLVVSNSANFADAPYGANPPRLPYLPDPLAGGASFNWAGTIIQAPPQPETTWPGLVPFRLVLVESPTFGFPIWDEQARTLTFGMPKADVLSVHLSTYPNSLDPLEAVDTVRRAPISLPGGGGGGSGGGGGKPSAPDSGDPTWTAAQKQRFLQLTAAGLNRAISPTRTVTFVHAVARPLVVPALSTSIQSSRVAGATYTDFQGPAIPVDGLSTSKVELLAEWDEPVDDGKNAPSRITKSQHVAIFEPATDNTAWDLHFPLIRHQFGDTKYRRVTYHAVATTRFLEYLDPVTRADPSRITQLSNTLTLDVPASAPPLAPKLLYVVPTFRHQQANGSHVRTAGIRVYLDRPWYSSGDGELLAVLLRDTPSFGTVLDPHTDTTWGTDPMYSTNPTPTPEFLTPANFKNTQLVRPVVLDLGNNQVSAKIAVGFPVSFLPPDPSDPSRAADPNRDPHDGRWYADIELDAPDTYLPMLRLVLARIQPNTVSSISPAVIANVVPLTPERTATVSRDPTNASTLTLTVAGPTFTNGVPARVEVTLQVQAEPGLWVSIGVVGLNPQTSPATVHSGVVQLPSQRAGKAMRLLVREFEFLPTDNGLVERLLYAELINV